MERKPESGGARPPWSTNLILKNVRLRSVQKRILLAAVPAGRVFKLPA